MKVHTESSLTTEEFNRALFLLINYLNGNSITCIDQNFTVDAFQIFGFYINWLILFSRSMQKSDNLGSIFEETYILSIKKIRNHY